MNKTVVIKKCNRCKESKPTSKFYKDASHSDGLRSSCKLCTYTPSNSSHGSTIANRERAKELAAFGLKVCVTCTELKFIETGFYQGELRCKSCCVKRASEYNREVKHNWPKSEYEKQYDLQEGKCLICKTPKDILCGDHNHKTGDRRGLLCGECNLLLGKAKDDAKILRAAADYLEGRL